MENSTIGKILKAHSVPYYEDNGELIGCVWTRQS